MVRRVSLPIIFVFAAASSLTTSSMWALWGRHRGDSAQEFNVKEHYTKYEYRIPMRDGKRLFTSVYVPKDFSRTYPILMDRTPYSVSPYGADQYKKLIGPSEEFERAGYIIVYQDVRGRFMSEGDFVEMRPHIDNKKSSADVDDASDTYDTIEWLLKNIPSNNGNVGIWGISYPGFYTSASIIDSHPALKAASPEAPMTDLFMGDDAYHGGAFMLAANFGFYARFKPQPTPVLPPKNLFAPFDYGTTDGYEFFLHLGPTSNANALYFHNDNWLWNDQLNHTTYDDYWKARNLSLHMKNIHCAVLTVGGWFDAEDLQGPFTTHSAIGRNNPGIFNSLVVGPWVHGGWARYEGNHLGSVGFASNTGQFFRAQILLPFFEQYLRGTADTKLPEAYVFETGTNVWRQYHQWPPKPARAKPLYFRKGHALSFDPPKGATDASPDGGAFDEYVSDPEHPVPFIGYTATGVPQEYMVGDQRFAATRGDVLVYQTDPLEEDITVAGPVSPRLFVSTSGTDSDWVVKLIDVYPPDYPESAPTPNPNEPPPSDVGPPKIVIGGFEQLVRGEPMRGKFRKSFEKPEPFTPGKVEQVDFTMPDVNHTFRRGHRIMVQVQSSWFPLVDRNPQTFANIPEAKPGDFQKATQRLYHTSAQPSGVLLHVLP